MGVTTSSAARMLGVSSRTIIDWSEAGILHPVRAASGWRYFNQDELERVAAERRKRFEEAQ